MASEFEHDSHQLAQLQHFFASEQAITCEKLIEEMRKKTEIQNDTNERLNQMLSITTSQLRIFQEKPKSTDTQRRIVQEDPKGH
jgi:hypothetical protein